MTDATVTEATPADVGAFAEFFLTAWRQAGPDAPGFAGATEEVIAELTTPEAFRARVGGPERRMYLARVDGRVVGFAATRRIDETAIELAGIIVLRDQAGRGVGTALVAAAAAAAANEGHVTMTVSTETDNEAARAFYERCGFTATGTGVEPVEGTDVAVVSFERPISADSVER